MEEDGDQTSFVIMPRLVEQILKEEVFNQPIPFIFSSATLSQDKDFSYIASSLGIENFDSFTVDSPFDYETQMAIKGHMDSLKEQNIKYEEIRKQIVKNSGHSLVLFSSNEEMNHFRNWGEKQVWDVELIYEGDREISESIYYFQSNPTSVLCSFNLWEGLDIPGEALTQVLITSLPFPPNDPVFKAKRSHAQNPVEQVDKPYMLLRLRQGIGRLIRTSSDKGNVHIWMSEEEKSHYFKDIKHVLPVTIRFD